MGKHSKKFNEADEIFNAVESIVLPMYNLENYSIENIKFKNTDKNRAVYKLIDDINNPKNTFCLKKVYYDEGTLLFIYSVMEWFARNEIKLPKMLPSKFNGRFVKANNMLFMLCPWVKGEKCNFDNLQHILLSIENLAKMHNCSRNFKAIEGSLIKTGFDSLYISTLKHFNKILSSFNTATKMKHKDKFSSIFLDVFDENIYLAKEALLVSGAINNKNLSRSLCHGDYVNKNILIDNTDVWVIDFDKASLNYSMYDLCYFMRRLLKRSNTNWDIDLTRKILKTYNSIAPLTEDDFKYVFSYLAFPQKYWRLSKDYYNNIKKCNKSMFVESLKEVALDTYAQVRFVEELRTLFSNEFKIKV
ncbi:MAG: CotS family spore coat protein [Clostridium perfringens]|uniref:CotS family spore coat protein n=1 Tax=Clostridium perfringens TaxID=1502 RepID=UPI001A224668|nr:CotS family spore coat protein [Clostridium perfringens]MDT9336267.1 CotS family spore coat protein [Clostridium perfringens]MDT9344023.1 CotS family spore coat protein [Clostridium perfringens]MDT9347265.1 CotS family spore coat protein [Clostridium perfringens]MDT9353110.1 CotS family spore coat protein [Clostridium perfringens]HAT4362693.1 CotS family spore coat protein [Clostridium perfringens]